jgi:cytoplasmic tRNA 2-thiolation protein 1
VRRSKPLKYAYEKEIVLYAHHRGLRYFSTECVYSPEAFRGGARALVKDLERARASAVLDLVRSGEDLARLCPGYVDTEKCGGECGHGDAVVVVDDDEEPVGGGGGCGRGGADVLPPAATAKAAVPAAKKAKAERRPPGKQTVGACERCGYMSSQAVCKACLLLESLNRNRPKTDIEVVILPKDGHVAVT